MNSTSRLLFSVVAAAGLALVSWWAVKVYAYVEAPMSLGAVIAQSTHIMLVRVESIDKTKNLIIYRKVQDIKGKHPQDVIKHNIGTAGLRPNEWKPPMEWAEPGKTAVFFHNGGASETCIGNWWYQAYPGGEWWNHSHGEPFLLRSFAGSPEKLASIVAQVVDGKEVVVPCMVDGNKEDLHLRRAKIQRLKVSLKLMDYNPKRDFVGWGGEDFRRVLGMPGFTHVSALPRVDPEAQSISCVDFDGDGKLDVCLAGGSRVALLQNNGEALGESYLTGVTGARSAVWADYNQDGKPDLALATPQGARLFTNLGGNFRDDSHLLPPEAMVGAHAACWLDVDADGRPDLVVGHGYQGLRLYRNLGAAAPPPPANAQLGKWYHLGPFNRDFNMPFPWRSSPIVLAGEYTGKNSQKVHWKEASFTDGVPQDLASLFADKTNAEVFLYREIDAPAAMDMPISMGSDDSLKVWLNGEEILASNSERACAPDQDRAVLKLRAGKNQFLMRVGQGGGDWAFYFQAEKAQPAIPRGQVFVDVSAKVGLGPTGFAKDAKFDALFASDLDGDGKPDLLYGNRVAILQGEKGEETFSEVANSGLTFAPGKTSPALGDFDLDGGVDLFVPGKGGGKLYRNNGKGIFAEITTNAGDLAKFVGQATSAAWGDFDHDGAPDLLVGCFRGPNRLFRQKTPGVFEDVSESVGLTQRIFNSQAVHAADINGDGVLDLVFNNEGQDSVILLASAPTGTRVPFVLTLAGKESPIGSRVDLINAEGKRVARQTISGGEGRGSQASPQARFLVEPGTYKVQVRMSSGQIRERAVTIGQSPVREKIDDTVPKTE